MTFRNAEELVGSFFRQIVTQRVGTQVPKDRDESSPIFVQVTRTGGAAVNAILDAPIVTTTVWGSTAADKPEITRIASQLRHEMLSKNPKIPPPTRRREEVTGLYDDPDPASRVPRVSFATRLFVRATQD